MTKKDIAKVNRASKDIWILIEAGIKTKNFAILEKNLLRLHALQKYYSDLLNFQDMEIKGLMNDLQAQLYLTDLFEKEWLEEVAKRTNAYDKLKDRIDQLFP